VLDTYQWDVGLHPKWAGSEDQTLYVLPHMRTLDQGQIQQCVWTWIT
jgi:hypothetical protein